MWKRNTVGVPIFAVIEAFHHKLIGVLLAMDFVDIGFREGSFKKPIHLEQWLVGWKIDDHSKAKYELSYQTVYSI